MGVLVENDIVSRASVDIYVGGVIKDRIIACSAVD